MRFYDPTRCPDCGAALPAPPAQAEACPACALRLTGQTAAQLQSALRYADQLLAQLRLPVPAATATAPYPAPAAREPAPRGARASSVPAVLLSLGALCLLVAAMVFLAVAWSWLGVGGRTAVLVGLTAGSGAAGLLLASRGLRVAAESLTVVGLGLLMLDVAGAEMAGWLGTHVGGIPPEGYGAVLAVAALALLTHPSRLVVAQLAAAAGLGTLVVGLAADAEHVRLVLGGGVLAHAALAWLGRPLGARVLPWLALAGGALSWTGLLGAGLMVAAEDLSLAGLWVDGRVLTLLVAAALALLPAAYLPRVRPVLLAGLAVGATLLTGALLLPALDESLTVLLVALVAASVTWSGVLLALPHRWAATAAVPLSATTAPLLLAATLLGLAAVGRVLEAGRPFTRTAGVLLDGTRSGPHPALLVAAVAAVALAATAAAPAARRRQVARYAALPLPFAALGTAALLGAPLAVVLLGLVAIGAATAVLTLDDVPVAAGTVLLVLTVPFALPSAALTTATAAVLAAVAALLVRRASHDQRILGGVVLPAALAAAGWAGGEVAGLDPSYRSLGIVALVGALALLRPKTEVEVAAALTALVAGAAGIGTATQLAVHLTLAGAVVTASALLHRDRRPLAWPGGLLLAAATWVRLAEIGVVDPEPYTLPSAVALLAVGLHRLRRDPAADTTTALLPGLVLATVPTLAWVLADPLSPRAVLLGGACLGLVLLGARLRWSAPLTVGAVVGTVVVLREAAPYLAETPQWVLIGTAGALLTGVGVTWERRVVELRRAGTYVGRLR